jgi:hypothetical protein
MAVLLKEKPNARFIQSVGIRDFSFAPIKTFDVVYAYVLLRDASNI